MINKKYRSSPLYGTIPKDKKHFSDTEIFGDNSNWKYALLKKIILWYGTPKKTNENVTVSSVLGIQCEYYDQLSGIRKRSKIHGGELNSNDIEVKELELKDNDYFTKFNISFDKSISYIKFTTKAGKFIEVGKQDKVNNKNVLLNNDKEPNMIHLFFGYYNSVGLRSLGCKYINKKGYLLINSLSIFRLRHLFKVNAEEKEKWSNKNNLNKLSIPLKAIVKLCLLPDAQFTFVIQFYF